jgi:t-SNARE complex subunit (syntaxin)
MRVRLKQLKEADEAREDDEDESPAERRMRKNLISSLTSRFVDLMQRFQELQTNYRANYRVQMQQQAEIIQPGITPDEVDRIIDHGDMAQLMKTRLIETDRQKDKATMALVHIKEQHRDIIELEQAMIELHQIFVDMAAIVEEQGEMINNIERNIQQACVWTGEAVKQLRKANKYKKKQRRNCCGLCGSCASCAALGVGALALQLAPLAACSIQ